MASIKICENKQDRIQTLGKAALFVCKHNHYHPVEILYTVLL